MLPVMKDVEQRLIALEARPLEASEEQVKQLKDKMLPVMKDAEKRLVALEA